MPFVIFVTLFSRILRLQSEKRLMLRRPTSATTFSLSITPISCRCTCDPSLPCRTCLREQRHNIGGVISVLDTLLCTARIGNCVSRAFAYIAQFHYSFVSFSPFTETCCVVTKPATSFQLWQHYL